MDNNDHRRPRQTNPSSYTNPQSLLQSSPQYSSAERFRQPSNLPVQSPTSAPGAAQARSGSIPSYGYHYGESTFPEAPMHATPIQAYPAQYPQDATTRLQQQQPYQQYGSNIMYNVSAQTQQPSQSPYDSVQSYSQPRGGQASAVEALQTLGVAPQYYVAGQEVPTSAPIATQNVQGQYAPIQSSYTAQSPVTGRDSLSSSSYAANLADNTAQGASSSTDYGSGQAAAYAAATAAEMDTAYAQYETELRRTFEAVRDGRIAEAGRQVVNISDWLLTNAELLGLVRDDESMHAQRLKMWNEFNNCWLSVLQKQKDLTQEMLDTGQRPQQPQSLMDSESMEGMGKELIRLCDIMEKHGLVDYQMGVWEEEIISLLTTCLDMLESQSGNSGSNKKLPATASSSSSQRRR